MQFSIVSISLLISLLSTVVEALTIVEADDSKFESRENSNSVSVESSWKSDPACLESNFFRFEATDGFFKIRGSGKQNIKSIFGSLTLFSNCEKSRATRTEYAFDSFDPTLDIFFTPLKNATISIVTKTFFTKSPCVIQSFEDFFTGELISFYSCGDASDKGARPISLQMVLARTKGDEYEFSERVVRRSPGFVLKSETKSSCKEAIPIENVITLGRNKPINVPIEGELSNFQICRVKEGFLQRIKNENIFIEA